MKPISLAGLFVLGAALAACADPTSDEVGASEEKIAGDGASTYFIVTHPDLRDCAFPLCGGSFVKQVNRPTTVCADGVSREECHVAILDISAIGLAPQYDEGFQGTFAEGHGLVRGALSVVDQDGSQVETLVATEAWAGASLATPTGRFYGLSSTGIVCFTDPCPTLFEERLNNGATQNIHGLDLTGVPAADTQLTVALDQLSRTGIIAVGDNTSITGPSGNGLELVATEVYTRLLPAGPAGQ